MSTDSDLKTFASIVKDKPVEEYTGDEVKAFAAICLAGKDKDGYSIFSGNLVTTDCPLKDSHPSVTELERKVAREVYERLQNMTKHDVMIDKNHLDRLTGPHTTTPDTDTAYVVIHINENDGEWHSESFGERYPDIVKLSKALRSKVAFSIDETTHRAHNSVSYGVIPFNSVVDMAKAVNKVMKPEHGKKISIPRALTKPKGP